MTACRPSLQDASFIPQSADPRPLLSAIFVAPTVICMAPTTLNIWRLLHDPTNPHRQVPPLPSAPFGSGNDFNKVERGASFTRHLQHLARASVTKTAKQRPWDRLGTTCQKTYTMRCYLHSRLDSWGTQVSPNSARRQRLDVHIIGTRASILSSGSML